MLTFFKVSNLAIIDDLEIEFRDGLNVLTGETGAGKSVLIGALNFLLGAKASPDMIRTGAEEASVEGVFEISHELKLLDERADAANPSEMLISRKLSKSGRSRCLINGNTATVQMLNKLGSKLLNIFGQHEHRLLLDPAEHIEILDKFGEFGVLRSKLSEASHIRRQIRQKLSAAEKKLKELDAQDLQNRESTEELTAANLKVGEEDELLQERDILKKATQVREKASDAYGTLYAESRSVMERLSEVRKSVEYLSSAAPRFEAIGTNFKEAMYRLEDVAFELRGIAETFHADPQKLETLEDRLALLRKLKKKYGMGIPELIEHLAGLNGETGELFKAKIAAKNLTADHAAAHEKFMSLAEDLSRARKRAAGEFEIKMKAELEELAMPGAVFMVSIRRVDEASVSESGLDEVEFLLASNPGQDPRPLAKIASGGELSRLMLAIKSLQVDNTSMTVIFDEVDTGIGGHTAHAVGSRLAKIADKQQVLCITHLHQVAAFADHHFAVLKKVANGITRVKVKPLSTDERLDELARMIGAGPDSESVKEHVKNLMMRSAEASG